MLTMCGWRSLPASEASFWKNLSARRASSASGGTASSTLIATSRCSNGSFARYTEPVAPFPSSLRSSYLPIWVCIRRMLAQENGPMRQRPSFAAGFGPALLLTTVCQVILLSGCGEMRWQQAGSDEATAAREEAECRAAARQQVLRDGTLAVPPAHDPRFGPPMGGTQS